MNHSYTFGAFPTIELLKNSAGTCAESPASPGYEQ